jgi:serine/threonine-protein kinase RsbW
MLDFKLTLPRDEASVPFVRYLCRSTLERIGVEHTIIDDIEVAVSEACTNVLKHSDSNEEYTVTVEIDNDLCTIEVVDAGGGFDIASQTGREMAGGESGRGISLMRALVDELDFVFNSEGGTAVILSKTLELHPASLLRRLGFAPTDRP